ncbi:MAG TPA: cbb3-type cytochrome c oxidase subunit II [Verrucomicrobiae bacterium]|jgi:cytochrome c oxidase cbb3-type subunit 2
MNQGPLLFLGIFAALVSSWWGLVFAPQIQIGRQNLGTNTINDALYPSDRPGQAKQGAEVYRAQGCAACHSQQVRAKGFGADIERGWGVRHSVAQDYIFDSPIMLGSQRIGPDLANVGLRQTNAAALFTHLYNPQFATRGSMMPPYKFLFEEHKLKPGQQPSPDAIPLPAAGLVFDVTGQVDRELVPSLEAHALVAYLMSLRADAFLFEAPNPVRPVKAKGTNAPASASTNAPAK